MKPLPAVALKNCTSKTISSFFEKCRWACCPLFLLGFHWRGEVGRASGLITHFDQLALAQVRSQDCWLGPVEVPSVFDGDHGVVAGNDVAESECAVEIALVAAKEFAIRFWIFGHENDHGSGRGFAAAFGKAFNVRHSSDDRGGNFHRRARWNFQSLTG